MKIEYLQHLKAYKILKSKTFLKIIIPLAITFLSVDVIGYFTAGQGCKDISGAANLKKKNNKEYVAELKTRNIILRGIIERLAPSGLYIVVDTAENVLFLKHGDTIIRKIIISAGSGSILKDPSGKSKWVFDTPRGEFKVQSKIVNPIWIKPDWAFIEEGEDIPNKTSKERIEERVLGDYALGLGNGYFIHGTLYTRLLGRNVTHGCIRVGDEDLRAVFNASEIGTKIFIF
jgi:L,D-transpeptidase YbiS